MDTAQAWLEQYGDTVQAATASAIATGWILASAWPQRLKTRTPWHEFLSVKDLQELGVTVKKRPLAPRWKSAVLITGSAIIALGHAYQVGHIFSIEQAAPIAVLALVWLIAAAKLSLTRLITPPYALVALCTLQLIAVCTGLVVMRFSFGSINANHIVRLLDIVVTLVMLAVLLSMPMLSSIVGDAPARIGEPSTSTKSTPDDDSTLGSWLVFGWMRPLIRIGDERTLQDADVWQLSPFYASQNVHRRFKDFYSRSMVWWLLKANSLDLWRSIGLAIVTSVLDYCPPVLLNFVLIELTSREQGWQGRALGYIALSSLVSLVKVEVDLQQLTSSRRAAVRAQSQLITVIFAKTLRRRDMAGAKRIAKIDLDSTDADDDKADKDLASSGKVQNMLGSDVDQIANEAVGLFMIVQAPVEIAIALFLLWRLLGPSAFAGVAAVLLLMPVQTMLNRISVRLTKRRKSAQDVRLERVNELINGIRFFKSFGLERRMVERVHEARKVELDRLFKHHLNTIAVVALWSLVPTIVVFASFAAYTVLAKQTLTVATAFTSLTLFQLLSAPLNALPFHIVRLLKLRISLQRISRYLHDEPEVADWACSTTRTPQTEVSYDIRLTDASFRWHRREADSKEADHFALRGIDIEFPAKQLSLIAGVTASGKSSLLAAILGEMEQTSGSVDIDKSSVSYCAQQPWLEFGSIRDNILFGSPWQARRYRDVIRVCGLEPDFAQFEDGDRTIIGERGISLSGGQQARVALARAIYAPSRVVLLDDPLAAVDAHLAATIFNQCLRGPLCRARTVILVTHHVQLCRPGASLVVTVDDGAVTQQERLEPGPSTQVDDSPVVEEVEEALDERAARKFVEDEERIEGRVSSKVYLTYLNHIPLVFTVAALVTLALEKTTSFGESYTIKRWSERAHAGPQILLARLGFESLHYRSTGIMPDTDDPTTWLAIYAAVYGVRAIFALANVAGVAFGSWFAARRFFVELVDGISGATFRWLDTTPRGRIANRCSSDTDTIDSEIVYTFIYLIDTTAEMLLALVVVAAIQPWTIIGAVVAAYVYSRLSSSFIAVTRDLRRLESNARSPLYSGFGELLAGISTVRAFAAELRFQDRLYDTLNHFQRFNFAYWMSNRAILLLFQWTGAVVVGAVSVLCISTNLSAGQSALVILFAQMLSSQGYWLARWICYVEQESNSIERVIEYSNIPSESKEEKVVPSAAWPTRSGGLSIDNLSIRYAPDLPRVLSNINLEVQPGEKIGVVGRSGAGKSTLAGALLRINEAEEGRIVLDGLNIADISLQNLRSRGITVLAQEVHLMAGSLRSNLDPLSMYEDGELLECCRRVGLIEDTKRSPKLLCRSRSSSTSETGSSTVFGDTTTGSRGRIQDLGESGNNLSAGTKQLLALARALLRRPALILLDEATASIDFEQDERLQATIKAELSDAMGALVTCIVPLTPTVITIAHRLRTVVHCDRIVVLDKGEIVEIGSPKDLLLGNVGQGMFKRLCNESADGSTLYKALDLHEH